MKLHQFLFNQSMLQTQYIIMTMREQKTNEGYIYLQPQTIMFGNDFMIMIDNLPFAKYFPSI